LKSQGKLLKLPKCELLNKEYHNLEAKKSINRNLHGNQYLVGKLKITLISCWRLNVDKSESLKLQNDPVWAGMVL
jgi:hypothetical protein